MRFLWCFRCCWYVSGVSIKELVIPATLVVGFTTGGCNFQVVCRANFIWFYFLSFLCWYCDRNEGGWRHSMFLFILARTVLLFSGDVIVLSCLFCDIATRCCQNSTCSCYVLPRAFWNIHRHTCQNIHGSKSKPFGFVESVCVCSPTIEARTSTIEKHGSNSLISVMRRKN